MWVECIVQSVTLYKCLPLEKEEVYVVVVFSEEVAQNSVWVATLDLIGRQAKVDALDKIPQLGHCVQTEPPDSRQRHLMQDGKIHPKKTVRTE